MALKRNRDFHGLDIFVVDHGPWDQRMKPHNYWGPEAIEAMGCLMDGMRLDDFFDFPTEKAGYLTYG